MVFNIQIVFNTYYDKEVKNVFFLSFYLAGHKEGAMVKTIDKAKQTRPGRVKVTQM